MITTVAGVCDILFGMRRCRIDLPNRCHHPISRVAHRALEFEGLQAANRKGRYDNENYCGNQVLLCWLLPKKPKSPLQRYRLLRKGKAVLS